VWGTAAVDVARDLVVFGTASCNRVPANGEADTEDVAGEKVYAVRYSTGDEVWRYNPPRPHGSRTDDDFGAAVQLYEVDGALVAGAGGKDGWYYALDAASGQLRWATQVGQPGHLSSGFAIGGVLGSPAVGEVAGEPALFITTAISTPVGAPLDTGSVSSLDLTLAEDPGRLFSLHALDASSGAVLWRSPLTRQTYGHPTYGNGIVYVTSTAGLAVEAFEADHGVPVWRSNPLNGAPSSGVAVTDDGIFVGTGTRQTDLGFKVFGGDSTLPDGVRDLAAAPMAADLVGADPQERLSGVWGFRAAR
jgi:outer membrane protein assembly factor BamB